METEQWLTALTEGDWEQLFGGRAAEWYEFVSTVVAVPGRDRVVLRWEMIGDRPWYLWVSWRIDQVEPTVELILHRVYVPEEGAADSAGTAPAELKGEPFFPFP